LTRSKEILVLKLKNLDDFEDLSSDFPGLRNLCSLIDLCSLCNLTGLNSLYSPISSKNFLILIINVIKMTNTKPFVRNGSSKIQNFTVIWYLFCQRLCYFFGNWLMKLKFPNLRNIQIPSGKF
jgi:hypothetical protein